MRKLFISPVPQGFSITDIKELIAQHATVVSCEIPLDDCGNRRGYAFVDLETHTEAEDVIAALNQSLVNGELISVTFVSNERPLGWDDVDPSRHPFDQDAAYQIAQNIIPDKNESIAEGFNWSRVTSALIDEFGDWAAYWSQSPTDSAASPWCCANHSWTTKNETAAKVRDSLLQWHSWFASLHALFEKFTPTSADDPADVFEQAAIQIINDTVAFTQAADAWYGYCEIFLGWYLEFIGIPEDARGELVSKAIEGRFESWTQPSDDNVREAASEIAAGAKKVI